MKKTSHGKFVVPLLSIAVLLCTGLTVGYCLRSGEKPEYITAKAERMNIVESVLASGTLEGVRTVSVGAQVSGQLKKLYVALGDRVRKGQLLAQIDPTIEQNALRDADAALEDVEAQKRAKEALRIQYKLALRRQETMLAGDASARADLESAQATLSSTQAEIAALDAQIKQAKIAIETARANLDYTRITAPMDGTVIVVVTKEGQTVVSAQSATTILKLADLDTMTVKAEISEADVTKVHPGQKVWFTILGDPDTRIYSTLQSIEPASTDASDTTSGSASSSTSSSSSSSSSDTAIYYYGLFNVPNPGHRLRVSMTAQVSIVLKEVKNALGIPISALGDRGMDGRATVRVLAGNKTEIRKIRTGISDGVHIQVVEGLTPGEIVVIGDGAEMAAAVAQNTHRPGPPPGM